MIAPPDFRNRFALMSVAEVARSIERAAGAMALNEADTAIRQLARQQAFIAEYLLEQMSAAADPVVMSGDQASIERNLTRARDSIERHLMAGGAVTKSKGD